MANSYITLEIMPGDTPASLAARHGVPVSAITAPNGFWPGEVALVATTVDINGNTVGVGNNDGVGGIPNVNNGNGLNTTTTQTDSRVTSGGFITFHLLTEQGPVEIPIRLDGPTWAALLASPMANTYGLNDSEPIVQIGLTDNFLADAESFLNPSVWAAMQTPLESLSFFKEIEAAGAGDLPPLSPAMSSTGIMWARDPVSGEYELIDTQPLYGPSLASFKFTPTDPNNPSGGGTWVAVPDLAGEERSLFEGVPSSVQPWLQAALDAGGDFNVVPEGPARAWVKFLLEQSIRASSRPPSELPFGIGLPSFPGGTPGAAVPTYSPNGIVGQPPPKPSELLPYTTPNVLDMGVGESGVMINEQTGAPVVVTNYGAPNAALSALTPDEFAQVPDWVKAQTGATYGAPQAPQAPATTTTTTTPVTNTAPPTGALSGLSPEEFAKVPDFVKQNLPAPVVPTPPAASPPPPPGGSTPQPSAEPPASRPPTPTTVLNTTVENTDPWNLVGTNASGWTQADFDALMKKMGLR